jgi:TonB family protein
VKQLSTQTNPTFPMPTLADALQADAGGLPGISLPESRPFHPRAITKSAARSRDLRPVALLTTSASLHLLLVGLLGFGAPVEAPRPRITHAEAPPPPVVEEVQIDAPPKAPLEVLKEQVPRAQDDLPAPAAVISAVPSNVAVAFAIPVTGAVHLVSDASLASGALMAGPIDVPQEVNAHSLLTPPIEYPAEALTRRLTGKVVVEFRTSARGDILDPKIRSSSGHESLDRAALENLRLGRWAGDEGYFTKTYEFVLR